MGISFKQYNELLKSQNEFKSRLNEILLLYRGQKDAQQEIYLRVNTLFKELQTIESIFQSQEDIGFLKQK